MSKQLKSTTNIQVRFADIDAMGHVNNAVYLSYFELARMDFFSKLIGTDWNWTDHGILLARNEINYKQPILLNDSIEIETWCSAIGNSSLTVEYVVYKIAGNDRIATTTGLSVLVCFDYSKQRKIEVPEIWKSNLLDA
ncbi:MAG: hypothetical protein RL226_189 [Bacteroidota bacterium]